MKRNGNWIAVALVATALCADRAVAAAPEISQPQVGRIAGSGFPPDDRLRRTVSTVRIYQPRQESLVASPLAASRIATRSASRAAHPGLSRSNSVFLLRRTDLNFCDRRASMSRASSFCIHAFSFSIRVSMAPITKLSKVLTKIFGSRNERLLKRYRTIVDQINELEAEVPADDRSSSSATARRNCARAHRAASSARRRAARGVRHHPRIDGPPHRHPRDLQSRAEFRSRSVR